MPQLDTSTWFITILAMMITLFSIMQLKLRSYIFSPMPTPKSAELIKQKTPWEQKWTKIYSPLSLPQH